MGGALEGNNGAVCIDGAVELVRISLVVSLEVDGMGVIGRRRVQAGEGRYGPGTIRCTEGPKACRWQG